MKPIWIIDCFTADRDRGMATWIVKKTVPKELYDSQTPSNKMKDDLKDISEGVDKLIYITETANGFYGLSRYGLERFAKRMMAAVGDVK